MPRKQYEWLTIMVFALIAASGARIVILSSDGHRMSDVDLDDANWERRDYDKFTAYGASKTANVLHTVELDRLLRDFKVRAYAVHPGVVATSLARHMSRKDFAQLRSRLRNPAGTTAIHRVRQPNTCLHPGVGCGQPRTVRRRVCRSRGLRDIRRGCALRGRRGARAGAMGAFRELCDAGKLP